MKYSAHDLWKIGVDDESCRPEELLVAEAAGGNCCGVSTPTGVRVSEQS